MREGFLHRLERVRGAHLHRLLALELDGIDGDHALRAGHRRALNGIDPDAADPHHHDRLAGSHVGSNRGRPPPGRDAARHERDGGERQVGIDLDDLRLGDARVLGERAELGDQLELNVAHAVSARAVGDHAGHERPAARIAQILLTSRAVATTPARRHERGGDVIAHGNGRHAGPDLGDDTGALVAADHREDRIDPHRLQRLRRRHEVTGDQVLVTVTEARVGPSHEHLTGLGAVDGDLLDRPGPTDPPDDPCLALHHDPAPRLGSTISAPRRAIANNGTRRQCDRGRTLPRAADLAVRRDVS